MRPFLWIAFFTIACSACAVAQEPKIDFHKDIQPILRQHCWSCHSAADHESGLRLDRRTSMLQGGDSGLAAVVPFHPEKSYLLETIKHTDEDVAMPPDSQPLSDDQIKQIETWIRAGAHWPGQMTDVTDSTTDHWSFQPVVRPKVPAVESASNPIDKFLLQKLTASGQSFSRPADARSLIRRVSIVLTGLPPTPEAIAAFDRDWQQDSDAAYTQLVDRLLESPHFGERWAQHWLDVIRWAETNGSESNLYRKNAWVYRDYVIQSFNQDKPYDQFIREQLAGDTMGVGAATGFLVAGPHVPAATVGQEPTAIRQAKADRMDEVMQTVGASVMGLTIGCARCHNHKFDPISIQDYYALTAVFQDIEFGSRPIESHDSDERLKRRDAVWHQIRTTRDTLREFGNWQENWGAFSEVHFKPIKTDAVKFQFKKDVVHLDELELYGSHSPDKNLALVRWGTSVTGFPAKGKWGSNPVERVNDGQFGARRWFADTRELPKSKPWIEFEFSSPKEIDRLRLSFDREDFYETEYLQGRPNLRKYAFEMLVRDHDGQWTAWVDTSRVNQQLPKKYPRRGEALAELHKQIKTLIDLSPKRSFVGKFVPPQKTFVLHRGSPENPRDSVVPAGPEILAGDLGLGHDTNGPTRRQALGSWMTRPENPLTGRVMVNRIWHHIFGQGIVPTTSDFGSAGAAPTHPELLDWLTAEFVAPADPGVQPWSVKSMIRLMVLSRAFRQSSRPAVEPAGDRTIDATAVQSAATTDRTDQTAPALLSRFPPRRVEAEVIRDSILQASGVLNRSLGGPSYRIHGNKKRYAQWEVTDNFGPQTWRRMIYQERMRRVDDQMFTAFDFPDCGQVRAKRPVSTTPLQALNLMNSQFVIDQSQRIARRASEEVGDDPEQTVQRCFELLLGRQPDADELAASAKVAETDGVLVVCRALINSNEFAFLP